MTRAYNVIDADGHILEPLNLWTDYIEPKYRDFAPRLIRDADGTVEIRSSLDARTLADYLRKELPLVHPSLRLVDVTRQTSLVGNTLLRERLLAVLSGFSPPWACCLPPSGCMAS